MADPIIDELLCFIVNKVDILPVDIISQLCCTTFSETEIEKSKKLLFDLCADDSTSRLITRKGDKKNAANIADMIKLLNEKAGSVPPFVAMDLNKLPPISYDSVDISVLLRRLEKTQSDIEVLKTCIGTQGRSTDDNTALIHELDGRVRRLESGELHPGPTQRGYQNDTPQNATPAASSHGLTQETATDVQESDLVHQAAAEPAAEVAAEPVAESADPLGKWTDVVRKERRNVKRDKPPCPSTDSRNTISQAAPPIVNKKRKPRNSIKITGTAVDTPIASVGPKLRFANVFATRFRPDVTPEGLLNHLTRKLKVDMKVEPVTTKYGGYRSFHITSQCKDPTIFMQEDVWPANIQVRWWRKESGRPLSSSASTDDTTPKQVHSM